VPVETIKQFAQYGGYIGLLTGVLIVALLGAIIYVWRYAMKLQGQNDINQNAFQEKFILLQTDHQKSISTLQEKYQEALTSLQDKRIKESKEVRDLIVSFSDDNNKMIQGLTEAMNAWKEAMVRGNSR